MEQIIPVPDGIYNSDQIPIILISRESGEKMLKAMGKEDIILQLDISEITTKTAVAKVDFWMSPINSFGYNFLLKLREQLSQFGDAVAFSPKFKFIDGKNFSSLQDVMS